MIYPRIIEKKIKKLLDKPEILILYGPRRVGKTTLLKKIFQSLKETFTCSFYSLDDPSSSIIFQDPSTEKLRRIFSETGFHKDKKSFLFLDEVQSFPKIDLLLKLIYDHFPNVKVMATSSSSLLLLNTLTESLAGRKYFLEILPLTLAEYKKKEISNYFDFPEFITLKEEFTNILYSFCVFGSYPEILNIKTNEEKIAKLKDILDSSLYKDIFIQENIKAPKSLISLVQLLSYQVGSLVNLNELSTQLGISRNTVNEYISILEKFFIVFRLLPFEKNLRSEIGSKFKVYFWDPGIRNSVINRFSSLEIRDDKGALFENLIITSIIKRNFYEGKVFQPFFWRTYEGYEIDLVLKNIQTDEIWAFQISTSKKIKFSRAFDRYHPARKIAVGLSDGYKYCL